MRGFPSSPTVPPPGWPPPWGRFPPPSSRSRTGTRFQKTISVDLSPFRTWPPRASACRQVSQRGSWYPMAMWVSRVIQRLTPR